MANEAGHWYDLDGKSAYTYTNSEGGTSNTTLTQARQMKLLPSVTGIMNIIAKPQLQQWLQNNTLQSGWTHRKSPTYDAYLQAIRQDADKVKKATAGEGQVIHGALDDWFTDGNPVDGYHEMCNEVSAALYDQFDKQDWESEVSFAASLGYGGKVDLHSTTGDIVVDFKTHEKSEAKLRLYDDHYMQLAAYREGMAEKGLVSEDAHMAIVFVHRKTHKVSLRMVPQAMAERGWLKFEACFRLWCIEKDFYPGELFT